MENKNSDNINRLNQKAREQQIADDDKRSEEAKKNHNFVQFDRNGLKILYRIKNNSAIQVFLFLAENMLTDNSVIISQDTLAYVLDTTRQTISNALKILEKEKMLQKIRLGAICSYSLNANVVWSTYNDKKNIATFKSTVILSPEEMKRAKSVKAKIGKQIILKNQIKKETDKTGE